MDKIYSTFTFFIGSLLKRLLLLGFFCSLSIYYCHSQERIERYNDSINKYQQLADLEEDINKQEEFLTILSAYYYLNNQLDSAIAIRKWLVQSGIQNRRYQTVFNNGIGLVENLYTIGELYESIQLAYKLERIIQESDGYEQYIPSLYNSIGNNLKRQKAWRKALSYYQYNIHNIKEGQFNQSIDFDISSNSADEQLIVLSFALMNTGVCYQHLKLADSAIIYLKNADSLMLTIDLNYRCAVLSAIALTYYDINQMDSAAWYGRRAISIGLSERGYSRELKESYEAIALYHLNTGQLDSAIYYGYQLIHLGASLPVILAESSGYNLISRAFEKIGNTDSAFHYLQKYLKLNEEISTKANILEVRNLEAQHLAREDSINHAYTAKVTKLKHKQEILYEKKTKRYMNFGIGILILFLSIISWRYTITIKQRNIISEQKEEVERVKNVISIKNQEILDSINYAKRIQNAILPPSRIVKEYLPQSFILYKPKDIVAGDFYWMDHKNGLVLFAVADCTGHGVPGAMVSVMCVNGLNRSVREFGLTEPGEILDNTRKLVIKEFEKSEEEVKDGMDIALCYLEGNILKFAGANNPLWIIRKGEIIEIKADKQPIGKYAHQEPFVTHSVELQKEDTIYLFSDGYIDQFGGEKGKKFKPKALRELLLYVQDKSMEEQRTIIDLAFEDWRGDNEQIDDVCMIGVKI